MLMVNETALALARLAAEQATAEALRRKASKSIMTSLRWYLAHAGGTEKHTLAEFERSEIEFYYARTWGQERVPKRELTAAKRNRTVMRPVKIGLWRGYFFVRIDLRADDWRECFERASVYGILANSEGGRLLPAPVGDAIIMAIKELEVDGVIPPAMPIRDLLFAVGEGVRINAGAFSQGVVHEDVERPIGGLDESAKIKIAVRLLGRPCIVEVPIGDIEKL